MKPTRYKIGVALALALTTGFSAAAQPNRVPGPTDFGQFSSFITERNIFNPQRYARNSTSRPPVVMTAPRSAPSFTLCGIMSYEKGVFAFFDGNQPNLQKVLYPSASNGIAIFTIADITATNVLLQSSNNQQTVALNIGQGMRLEGDSWQKIEQGGYYGGEGGGSSFGGGNNGYGGRNGGFNRRGRADFGSGSQNYNYDYRGGGGGETMASPVESISPSTSTGSSSGGSALDQNDVLKRLMQQRQEQLQ